MNDLFDSRFEKGLKTIVDRGGFTGKDGFGGNAFHQNWTSMANNFKATLSQHQERGWIKIVDINSVLCRGKTTVTARIQATAPGSGIFDVYIVLFSGVCPLPVQRTKKIIPAGEGYAHLCY